MRDIVVSVVAILMVCLVANADAFASTQPNNFTLGANGTKIDEWCDGPNGRLEIGDGVRIGCVDYECYENYMFITGVGYNAFVYSHPECYMKKMDDCCYQFVKNDRRSQPCVRGQKVQCPGPAPTINKK